MKVYIRKKKIWICKNVSKYEKKKYSDKDATEDEGNMDHYQYTNGTEEYRWLKEIQRG